MSSHRPNASPSHIADPPPADPDLAELVRLRGVPLLEGLESHLPGSSHHAEATGAYAFSAAVRSGLDHAAAELCRETARLHDVGMVYVPADVTRTPFTDWNAEQRAVFEAHYESGARLALGAGIPEDICGWLLRIRERFDGKGPDGLADGAIPVAARIARAACACDTLLASAEAGETLPERHAEAIGRLRSAAGAELDPEVVEALVKALSEES